MASPEKSASRTTNSTRILLGVTMLGAAVFAVAIGSVLYLVSGEDRGDVKEGSYLHVELSGKIQDAPVQGGFFLEPDAIPPIVTEISEAIRQAATDERIDGLYLELQGPSVGFASMQEIHDAIAVFGAEGKPSVAYAEGYGNSGYYLASACDRIVLAPSGVNTVMGLAASTTYYAGTFEKLGVEAEFEHVGDFKSAVEPYQRTGPSEPAQEATNMLLDSLYEQLVDGIAKGRGVDAAEIRALIDRPAMSPMDALERGMVDALAFPDAVEARIHMSTDEDWVASLAEPVDKELTEAAEDRFTELGEYIKLIRSENKSHGDKIAVVYAEGAIVSGEADGGLFGSAVLADKTFNKWLREARDDDDVKAVVIRVNSPGGSGLASDMMWREIVNTRQSGKPVVVSMGDYAASGGYFISAPADWIVAQPATLTGSIGVFGGKFNLSGAYEKVGMTLHTTKRGEEADMFSSTAGFSDTGREVYRRFLADFYSVFVNKVAEGRGMEYDAVHKVAQGRVWTGQQALDRHLVDELGGLQEALAKAAELAELDTYGVTRLPEQKDFFELLMEDLTSAAAAPVVRLELGLPGVDTTALEDLFVLDHILAGGGVAALLPGRLTLR